MSPSRTSKKKKKVAPPSPRPDAHSIAVIDIGTSSIRMALADILPDGSVNRLETLNQSVNLGHDTFTSGVIKTRNIEKCVNILTTFKRVMREYQVERPDQIYAVATSAVQEASNREAFLDRLYAATGIDVEAMDQTGITRLTYLSVLPYLSRQARLRNSDNILFEVGSGSTMLMQLRGTSIAFSQVYRLGSLRTRELLKNYPAARRRPRELMEGAIQRTIEQVHVSVTGLQGKPNLIALGGDLRFAAEQLQPDWGLRQLAPISVKALSDFTDKILDRTAEELVEEYHLPFPVAETLGPALLANVMLAKAFKVKSLLVSGLTMRDGLLAEMAMGGALTKTYQKQIVDSAYELGRKCRFDEKHAREVTELSLQLFDQLHAEHSLPDRWRLLLELAAILHEIGLFISNSNHHKHSLYLIRNSNLFGLNAHDQLLVALIARYHRRAVPRPQHEGYGRLDRDERIAVGKLAALLRVGDALGRSRSHRIRTLRCLREEEVLIVEIPGIDNLTVEQMALQQKGRLFEQVFGMDVAIRKAPTTTPTI